MLAPFAYSICGAALVLAVWSVVAAIRATRPGTWQLLVAAGLEVAMAVQAVIGVILLVSSGRDVDGISFVGYHLSALAVLVLGVGWGIADRSRWGNGVIAIAALTEVVLMMRLLQIWNGTA